MKQNIFLNISYHPSSKKDILEKIDMFLRNKYTFLHIVSLNPENMVIAQRDEEYRNILSQSDIQISDGVGITLATAFSSLPRSERITGVDLMNELLSLSANKGLRVLLLGGKPNLAKDLAKCYQEKYPNLSIKGQMGAQNILASKKEEEKHIFSIVADYKPQIIFAAFGSPAQEKWFYRHKDRLKGIVCMGVGGAFDFLSGEVARAPRAIRAIGLEWLYRLIIQPWRWRRQLRLIRFVFLVLTS